METTPSVMPETSSLPKFWLVRFEHCWPVSDETWKGGGVLITVFGKYQGT
jgi:hypothetical protein